MTSSSLTYDVPTCLAIFSYVFRGLISAYVELLEIYIKNHIEVRLLAAFLFTFMYIIECTKLRYWLLTCKEFINYYQLTLDGLQRIGEQTI